MSTVDERKQMREVLAKKGMGWVGFGKEGQYGQESEIHYWRGVTDGLPFKIYATDWNPFSKWAHCAWLIEAMRKMKWNFKITILVDCQVRAIAYKKWKPWANPPAGLADTFPAAVSLASYCALEANDATKNLQLSHAGTYSMYPKYSCSRCGEKLWTERSGRTNGQEWLFTKDQRRHYKTRCNLKALDVKP